MDRSLACSISGPSKSWSEKMQAVQEGHDLLLHARAPPDPGNPCRRAAEQGGEGRGGGGGPRAAAPCEAATGSEESLLVSG
jgi:hypothetical protein